MGRYLLTLVEIKDFIQNDYFKYLRPNKYTFLNHQKQILKYFSINLKGMAQFLLIIVAYPI